MFNIVSPSGNIISLDVPQERAVLAGVVLMDGGIVFVEQDPRLLPARLETAALGAWLGGLSFLYSVTFYFISLCFPHRA